MNVSRAGYFMKQSSGYSSFVSNTLPLEPSVSMDAEMIKLLSDAGKTERFSAKLEID